MKKDLTFRYYQYAQHQYSFVPDVLPKDILLLSPKNVMYLLEKRYGNSVYTAFQFEYSVPSPARNEADGQWLKRTNMVGINVRTIHSFWNVVKYAMTLPKAQSAVHLLPIWECGVVASLYGMASWNINSDFFSHELYSAFPHLDTVEKQLKVVVNLLHLMGKTVGMDVIPHTDRYSEIVLCNPHLFEWLQRKDTKIVAHSADLHQKVAKKIIDFIQKNGSATYSLGFFLDIEKTFFSPYFPDYERVRVLFGEINDLKGRTERRNQLIQFLYEAGYETVPATMGPPYRGIEVDNADNAKTTDADGRVWRDYKISKPEAFSRVFGPLARYKLHESKDNNDNWALDFDAPRKEVHQYVAQKYAEVARIFQMDFMRGDMSHVQMRADGVPSEADDFYDIHKYIKAVVRKEKPHFAYFAESFLAPDGVMAYGNEVEHLERSDADTTLGDLQSAVVGEQAFMDNFLKYTQLLATRKVTPNFTIMTADKDDPRFDAFYVKGNELRLFIGFFLTAMPSYMGLGFECRDTHLSPAPNEHYTKLYVFQINEGEKATHGDYVFGSNIALFGRLTALRLLSEWLLPKVADKEMIWLQNIDNQSVEKIIIWTHKDSPYVFYVNFDLEKAVILSLCSEDALVFSTNGKSDGKKILGGECWVVERKKVTALLQ